MNKIAKITVLAAVALSSLSGCIKETFPTSIVTGDQAASSDVALEGMVAAVASSMVAVAPVFGGETHYDFGYPSLMLATDALAGEFVPTSSDDLAGYNWFSTWGANLYLGPLYYQPYFYWSNYYTFIKAANDIIGALNTADEIEAAQAPYMAAAKGYRASYYLDMARHYDPFANAYTDVSAVEGLTVPWISESTTEAEARNNPRMTRDEIFEKIFADLDDAEELLLGEGVVNPASGAQPNLAVIYGLKARAYLWLGRFDSNNYALAAEYARKAINLKGAPASAAEWTSTTSGFNSAVNSWMWYLPQSSNSINNLLNYVSWLSAEATWGYGAMLCYGMRSSDYERMGSTDIRKSVVVGPTVDYASYKNVTLLDESTFSALYPYTSLKFRPANGVINDYTSGGATTVPLMRVEEMYLIEAEAIAQSDPASGAALLNSFMAYRDASYSAPNSTSVTTIVEEIIFQKRMEFWGEGIVFYDLKRLEMGIQTGYTGTNVCTDYRWNISGVAPWWNMCLPETESYSNTALIDMNNPDPTNAVSLWK